MMNRSSWERGFHVRESDCPKNRQLRLLRALAPALLSMQSVTHARLSLPAEPLLQQIQERTRLLRDGLRVIRTKNRQPERIEGCGSSTFGWAHTVQRVLLVFALAALFVAPDTARAQRPAETFTVNSYDALHYYLRAGEHYRWRTHGLPDSADSVLYLVRYETGQPVVWNDDERPGSRTSLLEYVVPKQAEGRYVLLSVAQRGSMPAVVDLHWEWIGNLRHDTTVSLGGLYRSVITGTTTAPVDYRAVQVPRGIRDPHVLALDSHGNPLAYDNDGGTGRDAHLYGVNGAATLILGSAVPATGPGEIRLLVNDLGWDADGDGVGAQLEAAVGTCDAAVGTMCSAIPVPADTDRDGLSDAEELFGVDAQHPQLLPRWGADPLHKDAFFEVDFWECRQAQSDCWPSQPLTDADIKQFAAQLGVGDAADLLNPDGVDGIRVHLDVGFESPDPVFETLYGDWGGSNGLPKGDSQPFSYALPERAGLFRTIVLANGGEAAAPGSTIASGLGGGSPLGRVSTLLHETGHSLGLHHEGVPWDWGMNCSPIYDSRMNYAAGIFGGVGFTDGFRFDGVTLNPLSLCEEDALGGADTRHLRRYGIPVNPAGVDWNRDGRVSDCSEPVRASINWLPSSGCGALATHHEELDEATSPALVRFQSRLYLFFVDRMGQLAYRHSVQGSAFGDQGCPNGADARPGGTCSEWSDPFILPTDGPVRSVDAFSTGGTVYVTYIPGKSTKPVLVTTFGIWPDGSFSTFSSVPLPAKSDSAPTLQLLYVDRAKYGVDRIVAAMWPDIGSGALEWAWGDPRNPRSAFLHAGTVRDIDGKDLTTNGIPPTLAFWGEGGRGTALNNQTWLTRPNDASEIELHVYSATDDAWVNKTRILPIGPTGGPLQTEARVAMAFRPLLGGNGRPLTPRQDRAHLLYVAKKAETATMLESNSVSRARPPHTDLSFLWQPGGVFGDPWYGVTNRGNTLELYTDPDFPFLRSVVHNPNGTLWFQPFPDGVYGFDFVTGNDWQVMERGLCLGLGGGAAACGGPNAYGY